MPVNMPVKTGGSIELVLKGIDTLSNMGILPNATRDMLKQKSEIELAKEGRDVAEFKDKEAGIMSQADYLKIFDKFEPAQRGEPGALSMLVRQAGGVVEHIAKPGGLEQKSKQLAIAKTEHEIESGKRLPADKVISLSEASTIPKVMDDLKASLSSGSSMFGPAGGRINSLNPYNTDAQTLDAQFRTGSQIFGRYMEGGVLRKEDEEKYRKMFPQLSDSPDVAANKLALAERIFARRYASDVESLKASGYNSSGLAGNVRAAPDMPRTKKSGGLVPPSSNANNNAGPPPNMTFDQFRAWKFKNGSK